MINLTTSVKFFPTLMAVERNRPDGYSFLELVDLFPLQSDLVYVEFCSLIQKAWENVYESKFSNGDELARILLDELDALTVGEDGFQVESPHVIRARDSIMRDIVASSSVIGATVDENYARANLRLCPENQVYGELEVLRNNIYNACVEYSKNIEHESYENTHLF